MRILVMAPGQETTETVEKGVDQNEFGVQSEASLGSYRKVCFCLSIFILYYFIPSFLTHLRLWCRRSLNEESHQPFDVLRGSR
jgi:hypothetical protein